MIRIYLYVRSQLKCYTILKVFTETNSKSYNEDNVKYQNSAERTNIKATKHIEHFMYFDWKDALAIQRKK